MLSIAHPVSPTFEEDTASVINDRLFEALSSSVRRRILSILSKANGTMCVDELVGFFDLRQPSVSHHLRILMDANLIYRRVRGPYRYYYACHDQLGKACALIASIEKGDVL